MQTMGAGGIFYLGHCFVVDRQTGDALHISNWTAGVAVPYGESSCIVDAPGEFGYGVVGKWNQHAHTRALAITAKSTPFPAQSQPAHSNQWWRDVRLSIASIAIKRPQPPKPTLNQTYNTSILKYLTSPIMSVLDALLKVSQQCYQVLCRIVNHEFGLLANPFAQGWLHFQMAFQTKLHILCRIGPHVHTEKST